jgi:hypothetical protein
LLAVAANINLKAEHTQSGSVRSVRFGLTNNGGATLYIQQRLCYAEVRET